MYNKAVKNELRLSEIKYRKKVSIVKQYLPKYVGITFLRWIKNRSGLPGYVLAFNLRYLKFKNTKVLLSRPLNYKNIRFVLMVDCPYLLG